MRAGKLDREITIQSLTTSAVSDAGTPTESWTEFATVRAGLIQASSKEFLEGYGEIPREFSLFRIRHLVGVTTDHRVVFEGAAFNIREVFEIGRRRGLELRCERMRP